MPDKFHKKFDIKYEKYEKRKSFIEETMWMIEMFGRFDKNLLPV